MENGNTNSGFLYPQDKEGNEQRPDFTGTLNVKGTDVRIAAWKRTAKKDGTEFLSLKVS